MAKKKLPQKYQSWIDARKRFHLSHAHIQMARKLGLNPGKFGGLDNNKQESWKSLLPDFINLQDQETVVLFPPAFLHFKYQRFSNRWIYTVFTPALTAVYLSGCRNTARGIPRGSIVLNTPVNYACRLA